MDEIFSVCQFFPDDTYEYVRKHVPMEEAVKAFTFYTTNVSAKIGMTKRVIITDSGDCVVAEWIHSKGLIWPKPETKDENTTETKTRKA